MPVCEGLPNGPCPKGRNDDTVVIGKGDLMLCPECDAERRRLAGDVIRRAPSKSAKSTTKPANTTAPSAAGPSASATNAMLLSDHGLSANTGLGREMVLSEVLAYVYFYRNKSTSEALRRTVLSSFTPAAITEAKKLLVCRFCGHLVSCTLTAERRNSSVRQSHEAEMEDITGIIDILDAQDVLNSIQFVAADLDMLPKFGPEELNIAAVVDRQVRMESAIKEMTVSIQSLQSSRSQQEVTSVGSSETVQSMITQLQSRLDAFTSSVNARLDNLGTIQSVVTSRDQGSHLGTHTDKDRRNNIIIFGIDEDRDATVWRQKVDDVLRFVSDQRIDMLDVFRLGKFRANVTRPILVKLRVVWDRRLLLSRRNRLKNYSTRGVFIAPDEPLEERRKQTLARLKYKAERDNKIVSIVDDVLCVDSQPVYSLAGGYINVNNG